MAPLTDFPELLRLAADLLTDPPHIRRIVEADDISKSGVDPSGPAGRLLGDLILSAPDGPDATHDTLTRGALAHGLRLLADSREHPPELVESLRRAGIEPNGTFLESCNGAVQILLATQHELRQLKTEVVGITASRATGRALAVDLYDFVQRLRERTRTAEQDANRDVRRANVFENRCKRYEAWFALPADQRHPMGPELEPNQLGVSPFHEGEQERAAEAVELAAPAGGSLADLEIQAGKWTGPEIVERIHDMTRAALQGFAIPPEMFGEVECGPFEQGRTICNAEAFEAHFAAPAPLPDDTGQQDAGTTPLERPEAYKARVRSYFVKPQAPRQAIRNGEDLAAWLRNDAGPADSARVVLDEGRLIVDTSEET